jgi:hypothetical protein
MTSVENFNINLQGTQASQLFLDPVFKSDAIATNFMVMGNVTGGSKKIKYHSVVENILKTYNGCGFQANEATDFGEKEVYLRKLAADLQYCWEDFADILWESAYRQGAADWTDLTGTAMQTVFQTLFVNGLVRDINRLAYFGDRTSASANFDALDGMWSVVYPAEVAASRTPFYDISEATTTALASASAGRGVEILKSVYDLQSTALYGVADSEKVFNVSRSVYDKYRSDLESTSVNASFNGEMIINGLPVLKYRGIDVVCNPTWTADATAAGVVGRNFVELTTRFNKVLVSNLNGMDFSFRTWFEQKDEKVYIMARPKIGFDIIHGTLAVVGYNN